jgi:uncharacterized protein YbjQ (UPF0145 family)
MAATGPRPPRAIDMRASLAQLARGGLPLRATERLQEEAGPHRKLFTSDLGVSEFLLARDAGCEPIAQVMGTSIFHIGQIPDYKGKTAELTVISDGHREARRAALARIFQEAQLVGADAVIGAHLRERMITMGSRGKGGDDGGEVLEFTVVGTAVRAPFLVHAPGQPIVTDLSGQDLWALAQDGWQPCGFLFEFCRFHGWHVTAGSGGFGELDDARTVVDRAREIATTRMLEQAARHGAEFVVGSDLTIKVKEVPCGFAKCTRDDLDVDISWFGTGIRRIGAATRVTTDMPPLILSMMSVGAGRTRRAERDTKIGADEDDADEVVLAAEEAEELALQADEDAAGGD